MVRRRACPRESVGSATVLDGRRRDRCARVCACVSQVRVWDLDLSATGAVAGASPKAEFVAAAPVFSVAWEDVRRRAACTRLTVLTRR